jgi:aromatic-L-amino-acid decarboxylase
MGLANGLGASPRRDLSEPTLADDAPDADPLSLSAVEMREIGYRTIDLLVSRLTDASTPAMRRGDPGELAERIGTDIPSGPTAWAQLLETLDEHVLTFTSRLSHPGYFAFIPASSTFAGALGDLISSALDLDVGSWSSAAGPSHLELVVLDWFKQWIGYPTDADGVLVSGGSAANLTALACAREHLGGRDAARAVVYASDQTHSSVTRAARLLGFDPARIRSLATDGRYRVRVDALRHALERDELDGLRPLIVVANAGATNTGAIDPLAELAEVCREWGLWLHVDAAYGGFAALTDRGSRLLAGLERADSITLDPHKWLYQPIECGCVLVREPGRLERAFAIAPDYLQDYRSREVDFCDRGTQLTRGARALKVWLSISSFGADAFRAAIDRSLDLARLAERLVEEHPSLELLCPATLGVLCFRRCFPGLHDEQAVAAANAELVSRFEATGAGLLSTTRLGGRYAIRMCVMNHTTARADVERTVRWLASAPVPMGACSERSDRPSRRFASAGRVPAMLRQ